MGHTQSFTAALKAVGVLAENVCLWVKPVPEGENEQRWISVLGDRRFSDGLREGLCKGMTRHY